MPAIKKTGIVVVPKSKKDTFKSKLDYLEEDFRTNKRTSKKEQDLLKDLMMRGQKSNPVLSIPKKPKKPKKPKTPKTPKKPKNQMKKRNLIYREKSVLQKRKRSRGV